MQKLFAAVAVVLLASATASAGDPLRVGTGGNRVIENLSGYSVPSVTRLHPVVGSIQRHGRFTNPFTHKAKYTQMVYNPNLGTFGRMKFRQ
jgi:hypothetical protein